MPPCGSSYPVIGGIALTTSTSRPTGADRYTGQWIEELDTGRVLRYDGTGWIIMDEPEQAYNGYTLGGMTLNNGTKTGYYRRSGGWLDFAFKITVGTTTTFAGSDITVALPVNPFDMEQLNHSLMFNDTGSNMYPAIPINFGAPTLGIRASIASGSYVNSAVVTSLIPFTWANTDTISGNIRYRMATRYS